jgi:hypothetical protein
MPRRRLAPGTEIEVPNQDVSHELPKAQDTEVNAKKGDFVVEWHAYGQRNTRVYSESRHGKDYKELAEEFAKKKNGKVYKK